MDIIDIMLAKAMTPQGKTDTYVAKANRAAAKAEKAEQDAAAAIATVENAADEITAAKEEANDLLAAAQDALETAQEAQINMPEVYTTIGQNTDGYMTQKAVTDALETKANINDVEASLAEKANITAMNEALATKADISTTATKQYVDNAIAAIPSSEESGGGISNLGPENAGNLVVIGEDGNISASELTEEQLIDALLYIDMYNAKGALGLDMNYEGKSFTRTQQAVNLSMGTDFNSYTMYGGRKRCNVADNGTITAFYGDANYKDDGSNGQVMIYQPKFYYKRIPSKIDNDYIVRQDSIIISSIQQPGFKLHPLFKGELEYVLLSAYEGSISNGLLTSIAGTKPISDISIIDAEAAAQARGNGWHITTMAAESANQMLEMIEFGTMNGQTALEKGISEINGPGNTNCASITGSTAILGNTSGHANETISDINGVQTAETTNGKRAISYRGMENPWGNLWRFIGGLNVLGDGNHNGGAPYICTDFNYTPGIISSNYQYIGYTLPSTYGWISAMSYNEIYDWVFLPAECKSTGNSLLPVGDNLWTTAKANENKIGAIGGTYAFNDNNGLFYYAFDKNLQETVKFNYGARLMFIPTKNAIYNANIAKWEAS